jgi:phosphoserine phosphatase
VHGGVLGKEEIIGRLETLRAAAGAAPILAFDGDGTLWTGDVGFDLYEALLELGDVREAAREGLASEARSVGLDDGGRAPELARSLYAAYQEGKWAHDRAFAAMAWAFAGWTAAEVDAFAREIATRTALATRVRSSLSDVVAWAQRSGVDVFIVSASPRAIVRCGAALFDVPETHILAMTPALDERSVLLPRLEGHVIYGDGKYEALRAARSDLEILGAFGDSFYDAPMLRAAGLPVAVEPSAGLREILGSIPGIVVLPA